MTTTLSFSSTGFSWDLLGLWLQAGSCAGRPEAGQKLRRYVMERSVLTTPSRFSTNKGYPSVVLVPLVQAYMATQAERIQPKKAALRVVRSYSLAEREELRQALLQLSRGELSDSVVATLSNPALSDASLPAAIGEALDLLMRDTEFFLFGASKTSAEALLSQ